MVRCTEGRKQLQNKERAKEILYAKLSKLYSDQKHEEIGNIKRAQIKTGDRSEKTRTYNYKDNRVTDHKIGMNFSLSQILDGDLDKLITAHISEEEKQRL